MRDEKMCEGRVCIVTGGGRGIGREHALMLAGQGALVVVNDVGSARDGSGNDAAPAEQVVEEIRAFGGEAVANTDDVSDSSGAGKLVREAIDNFGGLDVLVNNAGILRDRMMFSMAEEEWDAVINVHLKGTFAPSHHAAGYWRERVKQGQTNDARIINTTSVSGIYGNPGQSNCGAAGAGIAAFTRIGALELSRYGVTVNAIAPAALTRMTEDLGKPDEFTSQWHPRFVSPVVAWLASPLSAGISGQVIEASGHGVAIAEPWRRGPTAGPIADPRDVDCIVRPLLAEARPGTTMREAL